MDINNLSDLIINKLISVNTIYSDTGANSVRRNRLCWALLMKYEGETVYTSGNKKATSNFENIAILPKGSNYSWICTKQGKYLVIEFDADLIGDSVITISTKNSESIFKLFKELEKVWTLKHKFYKLEALNITYSILSKLLEPYNQYLPSEKQEKIQPALDYIAKNYNKQITNDELAKLLGVSTVYFRKLFTKIIGISPINYIQQLRIKKAKEMLKSDFSKISVISEAVGYPNIYYFSKMFKQITGVSPTEYAKNTNKR